jgi:hypothetical protein
MTEMERDVRRNELTQVVLIGLGFALLAVGVVAAVMAIHSGGW